MQIYDRAPPLLLRAAAQPSVTLSSVLRTWMGDPYVSLCVHGDPFFDDLTDDGQY